VNEGTEIKEWKVFNFRDIISNLPSIFTGCKAFTVTLASDPYFSYVLLKNATIFMGENLTN
jgi:hypothetical protein